MRIPRIYEPASLQVGQTLALSEDGANHIGRVLRMQPGQQLELFNGDGNQYAATITGVGKKSVEVRIDSCEARSVESPFAIHLGQVISRGDKMDFTIQKSVELGVTCITPLFSERCGVKLPADRLEKKREQWQKVVISACEQCGRNVVPQVRMPMELDAWLRERGLIAHLSISDEKDYATAFVVVERLSGQAQASS